MQSLLFRGRCYRFLHLGYNKFTIRVLGLKGNISYNAADQFGMKCTFFGKEASTEDNESNKNTCEDQNPIPDRTNFLQY